MNRREVALCSIAGAVGLTAGAFGVFLVNKKLFANNGKTDDNEKNPYECSKMVNEYLALHYCPPEEYMSYEIGPKTALDYPLRCAKLCIKYKTEGLPERALDIGCSVGRATFELAKEFEEVVGVDYSSACIAKCQQLKHSGVTDYTLVIEGDIVERKTATVDPDIDRSRAHFTVGDACALPEMGQFSCVLAANVICRLRDCTMFLDRLTELVVPGGTVVFSNPFTWLEQYTPKSKWLGGIVDNDGTEVRGFDALKRVMSPHFELVEEMDLPYLIRETIREHQWAVAHGSVWRRKKD